MTNDTSNLEISRQFTCAKATLYHAWTDAEALKQWWHPLGKKLVEVVNDLRPGGSLKYVFENESLVIDGTYETVTENELLVYTWQWHLASNVTEEGAYKLSVKFGGDEQSASLAITQEGFTNAEAVQPHREGWEHGLDQLEEYIGGIGSQPSQGDTNDTLERGSAQKPPISGYNETPEQEKVGGG